MERQQEPQRFLRHAGARPEKITEGHLARQAIVYVRQSTLRQVHQHQESGRVQYALKDRAVAWGWPAARVEIIDEDQGRSGARRPSHSEDFSVNAAPDVFVPIPRLKPCRPGGL